MSTDKNTENNNTTIPARTDAPDLAETVATLNAAFDRIQEALDAASREAISPASRSLRETEEGERVYGELMDVYTRMLWLEAMMKETRATLAKLQRADTQADLQGANDAIIPEVPEHVCPGALM